MYSVAGCAERLAAAGTRVRVLNVFTRTEHAPYRAPHDTRPAAVVRVAEDRAAAGLLGIADVVDLGFEDAPGRLGVRVNDVCDPALPIDDALTDAIAAAVATDLARVHGTLVPGWLVAPLAPPGAHVDHRAAHAAARRLAGAGARVAWYEDLPYATRLDTSAVASAAAALAQVLRAPLAPVVRVSADGGRRKGAAVACYASQTAAADLSALADALDVAGVRRGYAERLWVPAAATGAWVNAVGAEAE